MTVSGAYGRDYKSLKEAKKDWANGKDFVIRDMFSGSGRYINRCDYASIKAAEGPIMLRYQQDRKIGRLA